MLSKSFWPQLRCPWCARRALGARSVGAVDEVSGERFSGDAPRRVLPVGSLPYRDEVSTSPSPPEPHPHPGISRHIGPCAAWPSHLAPTCSQASSTSNPRCTLEALLGTIEQAGGRQVDTATACSLGRRTPGAADELMLGCNHLAAARLTATL